MPAIALPIVGQSNDLLYSASHISQHLTASVLLLTSQAAYCVRHSQIWQGVPQNMIQQGL
jgi:hypothetical protein